MMRFLMCNFDLTNAVDRSIILAAVKAAAYGLVAQLGAHHIRIVGVGSSNLLKSTNQKNHPTGVVFLIGTVFTQRRFEDHK